MVDIVPLFIWTAVVVVVALAGFGVAVAVRRWMSREEPIETFTFQDLREMRARGDISEQEFAAMRAALLARMDLEADPRESAGPTSAPSED
jgi:uncharacterized membrane protein